MREHLSIPGLRCTVTINALTPPPPPPPPDTKNLAVLASICPFYHNKQWTLCINHRRGVMFSGGFWFNFLEWAGWRLPRAMVRGCLNHRVLRRNLITDKSNRTEKQTNVRGIVRQYQVSKD